MTEASPPAATIDFEKLKTKEGHDLMLAMPPKTDFCRFYGTYVTLNHDANFPDHTVHTCIVTETFGPSKGTW